MGNLQSNAPPTLDLNQDQQQIDANLNPISAAFAQLPTAASTVFSTFSNIIKGSPSQQRFEQQPQMQTSPVMTHETTSDNVNTSGYMMAPSYDPNAPPPALFSPADESLFKKQVVEPPTNNTFRLGGHKKKTYAHIPGLSTHHQSPALQNFSPNPMMPPIPPQPTPVETVAPNSYYQEYQPPQPAYSQPQREPEKTNKFSLTSLLPSQLLEKIPSTKNLFGAGEPSTQQQQYQPQPFNGDQDFSVMTSTFEQPPQASSYFNAPPQNAAQFGAVSEPQNVNQMPLPPVSYFNPQQFNTNPFMHQAAAEPAVQQSVAPPMMPPMTIPAQPAAVATPPAAAPFNQGMFNPAPFSDVASEPPKIAAVSAETNLPPPTFFNPVEATQMFNAASNDAKPKNPYSSSRISRGVGMYKTRAPNDIASNQPVMMPPMPDPAASYQQAPVAQFTQSGVSQFTQPCVSQFMPTPEPQKVPSRPSSIPPLPVASFGTTSAETPQNVFAPPQASPSLHFGQPFQAAAVPSFQAAPVQTFQAAPAQPPPAASFFFDQTQSQQPVQTQSQPPMQAQSQPQVQKFQEHDVPRRKKSDLNVPEVSRTPPTFFSPPAVNQVDGNVPPVQNHRLVQSPPVNQVYEAPAPAENHSKPDFFTPEASKGHANVFQPVPTASEDVAEQEACNFQPPPSIAPPIESVSTTATPSAVNFFEPPLSSISNSEFSSSHSSSNSTAVNFFQPPAEEAPQPPGTMAPPQQQQKFFQPSPTSAFGDLSAADSLAPQCGSATSQPRFFDSPLSMSVASDATSNSANAGTSAMSFFQSSLNNEALSVSNTRSNSSAAPSINFFNPEPSVPDSPASNNVANTTPSDFFMDGSVVSPVEASKLNEELDDASVYSTSMLNNETVTEVYDKLDSLSMSEVHGSALSLFATSELDASSMQKSAPFESLIPKYLDTQASAPRSTSSPALPKNYRAVYRHWFYQNLYWHPFAMSDSLALDDAIANGREIVVTDGGRFEVNLTQRRRASIYWTSGTNAIRRCSWFYKNPQGHEHNLLPFDEETADFMEAEYEKAVLNNTWGHRLQIPASDSFLTFRDAANIEFHQTGQTLVVKRGVDEFVIDDGEVEAIDHLIVSVSSFGDKIDDSGSAAPCIRHLALSFINDSLFHSRRASLQVLRDHAALLQRGARLRTNRAG